MKIMIVVGARPNFMKAAPMIAAMREHNRKRSASSAQQQMETEEIQTILVHTGQHYDEAMSGSFFVDLGLPKPDVHLGIGSGSHAAQTAEIMRRFEGVLLEHKPDALIVVGDVNSTLACAMVAAKISYDGIGTRPLIVHVEAGLRSFDRQMPEEINRIITDHLSDLLFVTEESGVTNLCREGVRQNRIYFVGNTMIDSLLASQEKASQSSILEEFGLTSGNAKAGERPYALLTLHRPSNVDHRETFLSILEGLRELSSSRPIFFSAHPRTQKRISEFGLDAYFQPTDKKALANGLEQAPPANGIHILGPVAYLDFLWFMKHAEIVVTDSGGIQEETTCLGVPCVTVRENTERPVTVTCGTNVIAGTRSEDIREAVNAQRQKQGSGAVPEKWDGKAGARIIQAIVTEVTTHSDRQPATADAVLR
ncbi:MAG TPA: UDP-N-acetylglucosamine 2-epimerase (non-hydrolyzing) [Candidatus Acidoferrales bacterium]|jgi:UDP-N-acetylglucosamine 2-epimerase (non-hydrolysing)|nr:UDP-N-acetylglucosamine 2-epimerase (non-hydrolyzing) [Candidatus Acidoferrales bacterium]